MLRVSIDYVQTIIIVQSPFYRFLILFDFIFNLILSFSMILLEQALFFHSSYFFDRSCLINVINDGDEEQPLKEPAWMPLKEMECRGDLRLDAVSLLAIILPLVLSPFDEILQ